MGIRLSTTADAVILEEVHVPEDHLLGAEGKRIQAGNANTGQNQTGMRGHGGGAESESY